MPSSLKDNRPARGSVGGFLRSEIQPAAELSFVSAYFTVNAFEALKAHLESAKNLRFLFGEPSFISGIDSEKHAKKNFRLTETGLELAHSLAQRPVAKACAAWIERMRETPQSQEDLELVTWLVIADPDAPVGLPST